MKHPSLQLKIGLSYIAAIAAVLLLLNTYPLIVSQNMIFRSKQTTLQNRSTNIKSSTVNILSYNINSFIIFKFSI